MGRQVDGLSGRRILLHGRHPFVHGLARRVHFTFSNHQLVAGVEHEVRSAVGADLVLITLVKLRVLLDRRDTMLRVLLGFIGLAGEDDLVIGGLRLNMNFPSAVLLISNVAFIYSLSPQET